MKLLLLSILTINLQMVNAPSVYAAEEDYESIKLKRNIFSEENLKEDKDAIFSTKIEINSEKNTKISSQSRCTITGHTSYSGSTGMACVSCSGRQYAVIWSTDFWGDRDYEVIRTNSCMSVLGH